MCKWGNGDYNCKMAKNLTCVNKESQNTHVIMIL